MSADKTQTTAASGGTSSSYVTFSLADETYAIDVLQVQEVLKLTEIAPVPGVPDYILGIINLRGDVVTVIDARRRM
ncbi:MAG: chemotaxis protein CheW, partial [Chromatiaceae bacterium]|nr:chemotaxis protein CheW [Chromatiaceae bacterium]